MLANTLKSEHVRCTVLLHGLTVIGRSFGNIMDMGMVDRRSADLRVHCRLYNHLSVGPDRAIVGGQVPNVSTPLVVPAPVPVPAPVHRYFLTELN